MICTIGDIKNECHTFQYLRDEKHNLLQKIKEPLLSESTFSEVLVEVPAHGEFTQP
jgi:hypothetical protein